MRIVVAPDKFKGSLPAAAPPYRSDDRPGPASGGCDEDGDQGMNQVPGDKAGR